ncbi:hypothetical protein G9P44_002337 [Scheffersomyces stipitis]|nr:hypothetical protein G9P44_002337 [Scheffersomyces stipitis]
MNNLVVAFVSFFLATGAVAINFEFDIDAGLALPVENPYEEIAQEYEMNQIEFGSSLNKKPSIDGNVSKRFDIGAVKVSNVNSHGLHEFTPISDTIVQSDTKYYSFSVNTTSGLGEFYELLIFITGNICTQPSNVGANQTSLAVYYSFNSSIFTNIEYSTMVLFENGYVQSLADVAVNSNNNESVLYIVVRAPENVNKTATWTYQIGVSQNDLVFQWDDQTWAQFIDSDDDSALVVTGNLTNVQGLNITELNATRSQFSLYVYSNDYRHYFDTLNSSWCAVRNGPALMNPATIESSYTSRQGSLHQQFHLTGLNKSTKYIAYLISDFHGSDFGGAVYRPFEFETLDTEACELIYNLEFCNQIAYSVPATPGGSKEEVRSLYDNQARNLFTNFSKAIQQISCDTEDTAQFSPIKTCSDCISSYKDWLCAITIPRCSTRNITGYTERKPGESRNSFINDIVMPNLSYYEVMPCVNICEAIVRDCPAQFGFMCPTTNETIRQSYYWDNGGQWPTCNYVGKLTVVTNAAFRTSMVNWFMLVLSVALTVLV